jgi:hypothetical protein
MNKGASRMIEIFEIVNVRKESLDFNTPKLRTWEELL